MFFSEKGKYFPKSKLELIKDSMADLPDSKYNILSAQKYKKPASITAVSIFFGLLGIDRFLIGDIGMGLLKFLTLGLCFIIYLIDIFTIGKKTKDKNFESFSMFL